MSKKIVPPRFSRRVEDYLKFRHLTRAPVELQSSLDLLAGAGVQLAAAREALDDARLQDCILPLWEATQLACSAILHAQGLVPNENARPGTALEVVSQQYGPALGGLLRPAARLRAQIRSQESAHRNLPDQTRDRAQVEEDLGIVTQLVEAATVLLPMVPAYQ